MFGLVEPFLAGLRHGRLGACVDARANVHPDPIVIFVGVLLAGEGVDMPAALLVGVVNDPSLARFALLGSPSALAYRHVPLPVIGGIMSRNIRSSSAALDRIVDIGD